MTIPMLSDRAVAAIKNADAVGLLFSDDRPDDVNDMLALRTGMIPEPQGLYWESDDGRYQFHYNTKRLPEKWYAPFSWWVRIEEITDRTDDGWYSTVVAQRWCELRRDAKEQAWDWYRAYEAGELDLDQLRSEMERP